MVWYSALDSIREFVAKLKATNARMYLKPRPKPLGAVSLG